MKIITTLVVALTSAVGFAQLTVKPGTASSEDNYIYVKDEVLFVKEDINLAENNDPNIANIYLRHEGQLIQGTEGSSTNSGSGKLSVFQEGEADEYDYNYWGAPVGLADDTTGNTPFGITLFQTPTTTTLSTPIDAIGGYTSYSGVPVAISKYWIWTYAGATGYSNWHHVEDATNIGAGLGFSMKGVRGNSNVTVDGVENNPDHNQRYDFRGRPRDGTINIPIATGQNYLVGNPYPSALDLSYFLLENSVDQGDNQSVTSLINCTNDDGVTRRNSITGIAYFWDSDPDVQSHNLVDYKGGYETFAPVDCSTEGIHTPATFYMYDNSGNQIGGNVGTGADRVRRYTPIGQGFFVEGAGSEDLQFKNTHRKFVKESSGNSDFHRYAYTEEPSNETFYDNDSGELEAIPKLRLNIVFGNQYTRQLALAFWPTATEGVDAAMDAKNMDGIGSDAGWLHNNSSYVIDVRPFDITTEIPIYLKLNTQKNVKFNINNFENFDTENVYILDKATQIFHPIKEQTFSITLPQGNYNDRFKLTFINAEDFENMNTPEEMKHNFDIFQNNNMSQLEIRNPDNVEIKQVAMFDINGRKIFSEVNLSTESTYVFPTKNIQEAVYIVRVTTSDNKETSKKISVRN